ncbi:AmpG family muropeptide MFS transporter [Novosphingobium colocasiae]|uniref:MFS transporter n=1 Tax=Novosphingobium colocasiae TaxID=1256513 RepID=A0A918PEI1_9SPHN|nr:MFS transporter [Novosphingobium colocasiae]GGZ02123.1 MFS transporter [Novosphingobium colocasiae]
MADRKTIDVLRSAFTNRKTGVMLVFGMASGLPYALLLGTLYAWLGETGVDLETMGVFSLIGLAYAFKFLWSPLVDRGRVPFLWRLGRRRSWLVPIQALVGTVLIVLASLDPVTSLGMFSLLAGIAAFASATQDIAIDAWRVEVADEDAPLELLSSIYQLGYRLAALAGGALALIMAARIGWPLVYGLFGGFMYLAMAASWFAPDTAADEPLAGTDDTPGHGLARSVRLTVLALVGALWGWALVTVLVFMVRSLGSDAAARPDATAFIKLYGPLIVIATVVVPAVLAGILDGWRRTGRYPPAPGDAAARGFLDHAYDALIDPLSELVSRLGWAAILVLAIVLTYRLTDSIWGPFALPFYLQELHYTNDEVAIASKFFGVGMTMGGIALAALLFAWLGRMPTVILGAVLAAASNLLYADLAQGGAGLDAFGRLSGFTWAVGQFGADPRLARLLLAIAGENLAGGIAGAAFVAYLSGITAKSHAAVQYALLSSLTVLVGSLGRAALGQMIEEGGYARVFYTTAALGLVAVVLCVIEAMRQARAGRRTAEASVG